MRRLLVIGGMIGSGCMPRMLKQEASKPHFIPFQSAAECGFTYGYYPELRLCIQSSGASNAAVERQKRYFAIGVSKWMGALREVDPRITDRVSFTCNNYHLQINVQAGSGIATSGCGFANVYSYESQSDESGEDLVLQGTTLHELGHGLAGLSDTYSGRQAGACKTGQPESIMCWGGYGSRKDTQGYKTIYEDDIQGIQAQFNRFQSYMNIPPGGIPPAGANNGGSGLPPISTDLVAAIGRSEADPSNQIIAVSTGDPDVRITVCDQSNLSACPDPFANQAAAIPFRRQLANRFIFGKLGFNPDPRTTYTIIAWKAQGQAVAMRRFGLRLRN